MTGLVTVPITAITSLTAETAVTVIRGTLRSECRYSGLSPTVLTVSSHLTIADGGIDADVNTTLGLPVPTDCLFQAGLTGPAPLGRVVVALEVIYDQRPFYGCAFMNAVAEHAKGELWLRELAADHHREILSTLEAHAVAAGYEDPALLARQLLLVLDGAMAALMVSGDRSVFAIAGRNLRAILLAA